MEELNNKLFEIIAYYIQKIEKYFATDFEFVVSRDRSARSGPYTMLYIKYSGRDTYFLYYPVDYQGVGNTILSEELYNVIAKDIIWFIRKIEGVK